MKPNQAYLLFHSKEDYQEMKRQPREWEKILANDVTDETDYITQQQTTQLKNGQKT